MKNPWLGLQLGVDPVGLARALLRARVKCLTGEDVPGLRTLVTDSWERSCAAGVDPERHRPRRMYARYEAEERWRAHPLHRFAPLVQRLLCDFAYDAQHMVVIADAQGCLLWTSGHPKVLAASERISFCPGFVWSEEAVGTNGVGTALSLDHPVQIFAAEHYNVRIHAWTCSGAPVHDPETGEILGVIDVSSGVRAAHPHSLALVSAAAAAVESVLRGELDRRRASLRAAFYERAARSRPVRSALVDRTGRILACHPRAWLAGPLVAAGPGRWFAPGSDVALTAEPLADGAGIVTEHDLLVTPARPRLQLRALGSASAVVSVGGLELELSPRRSELVVLLALHPDGLTAEQLAAELFGDAGKVMCARAEICRLRRQLVGLIATRPYRLVADVDADFLQASGDAGPLLPGATSASIVAARERLAGEPPEPALAAA